MIKNDMEEYAFSQYQSFYSYFDSASNDELNFKHADVSGHHRLEAEDIFDQTTLNGDLLNANDPESIQLKSTILAKYMTLDQVLERRHGISEI